jgi:hypothetical protein
VDCKRAIAPDPAVVAAAGAGSDAAEVTAATK